LGQQVHLGHRVHRDHKGMLDQLAPLDHKARKDQPYHTFLTEEAQVAHTVSDRHLIVGE
jgi:hypothetical protein